MEVATGDSADFIRSITKAETGFGYWWRYLAAPHHPDEAITAMIHIANVVADAEARHSGKTYLVGRAATGNRRHLRLRLRSSRRAQRRP